MTVNYRKLNDRTVKETYPLKALFGPKNFGTNKTMDVNSGFWQVALHPMDKQKTAFSTSLGLYQFVSMPFHLCS